MSSQPLRPFAVGKLSAASLLLGLALFALVMLGPVVQPWYLLWGLIVLAGAGVAEVASCGVVHGGPGGEEEADVGALPPPLMELL